VKALDGRDRLRANAAATALREIRGQTVTGALTTALPRVSPAGRARLLDVIAERGDPGAAAAVATAMEDADAGVRLRAIAALGRLGGDRAAKPLLVVAGRGSADEKAAAAVAIGMLRGTGVASRLTDALGDGAAAVRAAALTALRARRDDVPLPVVVRMAQTDKGEPRTAALAALRDLGGVAEARALVDMLARPGVEEPEAVASTVAHIARKHPGGIEPVRAALARTKGAPERGVLLTCLGEIGGPAALESLTAALGDGDGDVQMAALRALAEWPTPEPTAALRDLAGKPPSERVRAVAFRGYVRMLRQSGNVATGAQGFGHAIELARSDDEKRLLLSGLATVGSADALALAIGLSASPGLRAEAEMAALAIAQMTAAAWPNDTRDALAKLAASAADEGLRAKATALMATMGKFGDFVLVWEVSPSYEREGANFTHLFDLAFPPETGAPDAEVGWRAMPVGTAPDQPWLLDLLALHGGEQKVAYLRTSVHADTARDLVLEIGSDDGPKVWWNGQVVFANNTPRAAAPGQDKVTVGVKAGWNSLMVKVTQNVMGWGLVARFTEADGAPATALRFALPSMVGEPPAAATR
jgi:HEAT repeat protein